MSETVTDDPQLAALRQVIWQLDDLVRNTNFVPRAVHRAMEIASRVAMSGDPAASLKALEHAKYLQTGEKR